MSLSTTDVISRFDSLEEALKSVFPKDLFVSALDAAQEMISILPGVKLDDVVKKPVDEEQFLYKVRKMTLAA
jgi:hypothetical protein